MKALISMVTLALALAVTGPAFAAAGDLKGATNQSDCEKAGGVWDANTYKCSEKK